MSLLPLSPSSIMRVELDGVPSTSIGLYSSDCSARSSRVGFIDSINTLVLGDLAS